MSAFFGTLLWALLAMVHFAVGLLIRAVFSVIWLFWPLVMLGFLIATAHSAHAGWWSWLWGSSGTRHLERSLEIAEEAAKVASQAAEAQAHQAVEQARQNSTLAETLGQLSSERTNLADHLHELTTLGIQDSQWAAALTASGPVLVCITVLIVAALALWLTQHRGAEQHTELAEAVDLLAEELSQQVTSRNHLDEPRMVTHRLGQRHESALVGYRADGPTRTHPDESTDEPMPF